ncbi:hypothetical protein CsSME_00045149 [Camellia sinensis var. sinensis]
MRDKTWALIDDSISRNHVQSLLYLLSEVRRQTISTCTEKPTVIGHRIRVSGVDLNLVFVKPTIVSHCEVPNHCMSGLIG